MTMDLDQDYQGGNLMAESEKSGNGQASRLGPALFLVTLVLVIEFFWWLTHI